MLFHARIKNSERVSKPCLIIQLMMWGSLVNTACGRWPEEKEQIKKETNKQAKQTNII